MKLDYYIPWEQLLLIATRAASAFCIAFSALFGVMTAAKCTGLAHRAGDRADAAMHECESDEATMRRVEARWNDLVK